LFSDDRRGWRRTDAGVHRGDALDAGKRMLHLFSGGGSD
jgi:hypothetical protein